MWLKGVCEWEGVAEEFRVSRSLSYLRSGRSEEVAPTLIIIATITFHPPLLSPTGPPILGCSHPACPGGPLSPF